MISVEAALAELLSLVAPLEQELVPFREAAGRVLARDIRATHAQPPF
ncbi:MAG: molybdopterin molybdenumtransferase MoeA, partial [Pseudomonadota bacterium]